MCMNSDIDTLIDRVHRLSELRESLRRGLITEAEFVSCVYDSADALMAQAGRLLVASADVQQ